MAWAWLSGKQTPTATVAEAEPVAPILDLDGRRLTGALESLVAACDEKGGVELLVKALKVKSALFEKTFANRIDAIGEDELLDACAFIATVRRRIGKALDTHGLPAFQRALTKLLDTREAVDARLAAFVACFPPDKAHRWVRDLGAEILHFIDPDAQPLMARWIWDSKANTGVLREIWYGEHSEVDAMRLSVADDYLAHSTLREELDGFLKTNGVFSDRALMIDLLCAYIYGEYIATQGASFLKTHFSGEDEVLPYALRMLGLDGIDASGRSRLVRPDQKRHVLTHAADIT